MKLQKSVIFETKKSDANLDEKKKDRKKETTNKALVHTTDNTYKICKDNNN